MSHVFKIGDRFRLIHFSNDPDTLGREGVVDGFKPCGKIFITLDGYGSINVFGVRMTAYPHWLEPLSPPKSQISEILAMKDLPNRDCKIARVGECA